MNDPKLIARVAALAKRRSKAPSHVEEMRSAVVAELQRWAKPGGQVYPQNLLAAVERYDRAKGGPR